MLSPESGGSWGILGGAFDPVHFGHLSLAEDILLAKSLTGVLFVPSYNPPRKQNQRLASIEQRAEMIRLAIADRPEFALSLIETESDDPGYTLLTIRALKKRYPSATFVFIIGADLLGDLDSWYQSEQLLLEITIIAGLRPHAQPVIPERLAGGPIELVPTRLIDIASQDIRALLKGEWSVEMLAQMTPRPVAEYIAERNLYA